MPEFKIGDLVVYPKLPHNRLFKVYKVGGDSIVVHECWDELGAKAFTEFAPYSDIRHATPDEIVAGYKINR